MSIPPRSAASPVRKLGRQGTADPVSRARESAALPAGAWCRSRRRIAFDPAEELPIPEPRVLRLENPVVFVREIDQTLRNLLRMQSVVVLQRLRCRHPVIQLAMN